MTDTAAPSRATALMLMSVHPQHVRDMLDGSKTIELRKTRPLVEPGQPVAVYSTLPTAAIVLTCRVDRVVVGSPASLWDDVSHAAAVGRSHYDRYFDGAPAATAIHLDQFEPLDPTIGLADLRRNDCSFRPPQTWTFLTADRLATVLGDHPSAGRLSTLLT